MIRLSLTCCTQTDKVEKVVEVSKAVIAGWTGRDADAVEAHIVELEELGVTRPATVPTYYPVTASNLTTAPSIEALGGDSSGEIEFVILRAFGEFWIGAGSDHTDRKLEVHDVNFSKQACAKPVASSFWLMSEVIDHWNELQLLSYILEGSERITYQEGSVTALLHPEDLIAHYEKSTGNEFKDNMLMFGGTLPAVGGIRPSSKFEFTLHDPILERSITHSYVITEL